MPRVKTGSVRKNKHKKVLDQAKGNRTASGNNFKQAKQAVMRGMAFSTRDRAQRKRKMRELWIIRINAAARMNGLSYSKFMFGLKKSGIELDRKVLAEMAYSNTEEFAKIVEAVKASL